MPRSKRSRVVALTQTRKKTRDHKQSIIEEVRTALDSHESVYLFSYENMRSTKFKNIRVEFRNTDDADKPSSRIFMGKNKLLQIALGRTIEEEYADGLHHMSKHISSSVGLLATCRSSQDVEQYFGGITELDFARAGSVAPKTVTVTEEMMATHPTNLVEQFRKLGLPVEVKKGKLGLTSSNYVLCKKGAVLTAENAKALVHFGIKLAEFKVTLVCRWNKGGEFEML